MRMPSGGSGSRVRGGPRAGWAAIVGIAIGAALLAGLNDSERATSALQPAGVTACQRAESVRRLQVSEVSVTRSPAASSRCRQRSLYP